MKFGVKTYADKNIFEVLKDKADFFEIMAIPGEDYSFLKNSHIPIVIHAQHGVFGINFAENNDKNEKSIKFAISLADLLHSKKIIVHVGELKETGTSIENVIKFLKKFNDKRILLENLPEFEGRNILTTTPKEMKYFLKETGLGFCFDINHAIHASTKLGKPPFEFVNEFISLKPTHFHICGHKFSGKDHISIADSEYNIKEMLRYFPKDAEVTLEVSRNAKEIEKDLEIVRKFAKEL